MHAVKFRCQVPAGHKSGDVLYVNSAFFPCQIMHASWVYAQTKTKQNNSLHTRGHAVVCTHTRGCMRMFSPALLPFPHPFFPSVPPLTTPLPLFPASLLALSRRRRYQSLKRQRIYRHRMTPGLGDSFRYTFLQVRFLGFRWCPDILLALVRCACAALRMRFSFCRAVRVYDSVCVCTHARQRRARDSACRRWHPTEPSSPLMSVPAPPIHTLYPIVCTLYPITDPSRAQP